MPRVSQSGAFVIKAPRPPATPVVFDSPHSGFVFPPDFDPVASREQIQASWDAYVDELCAGVTACGASLLAATFPRAYVDANRAVDDIDSELLDTPWPQPTHLSDHSRRGMGLIRRLARPGVPMYDRHLTVAEIESRIDDYYTPYRRALRQLVDAAWKHHGAVWHFNCHSMKSRGNAMNRFNGASRPDFVIGDRHGTTSTPALTRWVADFFMHRGYSVRINDPYAGADIIREHGDPPRRRYSLQIEINRALYMDETNCERGRGFSRIRGDMTALAGAVEEFTRPELAR